VSYTRRSWIGRLLGALPLSLIAPRPSAAQSKLPCEGHVRGPGNAPHVGWSVQLFDSAGVRTQQTDLQGHYEFLKPAAGPSYKLIFRDGNNQERHEVRLLTASANQTVSVTIDPSARTFTTEYSRVQALESVAVTFAYGTPQVQEATRGQVQRIPAALSTVRDNITGLPTEQVRFLSAKVANVEQLLQGRVG
jgi:hypothetical protein